MTHCHPFDGQHPITIVFRLLRGEVMGRRHKEGTEQKPVSGTQECYRNGLHFTPPPWTTNYCEMKGFEMKRTETE